MTARHDGLGRMTRKRVAVLYTLANSAVEHGSKLAEAEDLTANAQLVAKALRTLGHLVRCVSFGQDAGELVARLTAFRPEIVFNLAEGPLGCYAKEAHATALLELLGLAYTGNGLNPLVLCKNKAVTKQLLQAHGVPTPRFLVCRTAPAKRPTLTFPLVVKPLRQDGSIGITDQSVVSGYGQLRASVADVLKSQQQEALVEEFMSGREFNVSVLGNGTANAPYQVLPPGELVYHSPCWRVCTFQAKWDEAHPSYAAVEAVCPATISARLHRELGRLTLDCARIFELSGYARLDFRLDQDGRPQLLDINPNPDLAPRMGIARAAEAAGLGYPVFIQEILRLGLEQGAR